MNTVLICSLDICLKNNVKLCKANDCYCLQMVFNIASIQISTWSCERVSIELWYVCHKHCIIRPIQYPVFPPVNLYLIIHLKKVVRDESYCADTSKKATKWKLLHVRHSLYQNAFQLLTSNSSLNLLFNWKSLR